MIYAGIGSRETPSSVLADMQHIAQQLAEMGWILRSGGAPGADTAFEKGCDTKRGTKEIYVPWESFECRHEAIVACRLPNFQDALQLASKFHPAWDRCKQGARALHARNSYQILGKSLTQKADCVICWTRNASGAGGTGQALRIARHFHIPIFDLGDPRAYDELEFFVKGQP